mmetsp:Transcript_34683/g.53160  ORF Transcript_34683/g.53160 Transcript_34683/m.53160 type:complete len:438 (-) Transcript_34683:20-1333(-)
MHMINQLFGQFSSVSYTTSPGESGEGVSWFDLPRSIKNNILVELNINSLSEAYDLNTQTFKDVIGSLNWKKFADRIQIQLKENQLLTQNQRNMLQVNAVISLIKSNSFDEARAMLDKIKKQPHFQKSQSLTSLCQSIKVYLLVKDKKYEEALGEIKTDVQDFKTVFLKAYLLLSLKKQKDCVHELVNFVTSSKHQDRFSLVPLVLRLAHNYKVLDDIRGFIDGLVSEQLKETKVNIALLESLISIGMVEPAFKLIEKCNYEDIKNDKQILGIYMNLMTEKDLTKAYQIQRQLLCPTAFDLVDEKLVEEDGLNEEDCITKLIELGMPEKTKERKTTNVLEETQNGAEIFMPTKKKKTNRVHYPKGFDPENPPAHGPDPERWLPKWQRSRFKKMAKKKGIYLKGAQGDAQIDTDVTNMGKSTAHQETVQESNTKRRKKK